MDTKQKHLMELLAKLVLQFHQLTVGLLCVQVSKEDSIQFNGIKYWSFSSSQSWKDAVGTIK
ncbi:hypothetical protein [Vibrio ostreae]|uniref:Uncharacterized protein n=1 Tax=Vibrio ostreae TaxID=2841925 RepID=A0A975U796_9VIBR|nr:hypothetical protein [Vibrio ostreae]QXO16480.1 hypothetical protein KNV97_02960 [Vibrio ostreae]